jgi:hypothetical protein
VFTTKVGSRDVAIGPGYVIDQLLLILDRQIDRKRALVRTELVKTKMKDVDFQRVVAYVSTMILGSRQSMSLQDQEDLANQLKQIQAQPTGAREKSFALGFLILDFMGEEFLEEVFRHIDTLDLGGVQPPSAAENAEHAVDNAELVRSLLTDMPFADAKARLEKAIVAADSPLTPDQKDMLHQALEHAEAGSASDQRKAFSLGFACIDIAGPGFIQQVFAG